MKKRIVIILSNSDRMGMSGNLSGVWFDELATPYLRLVDEGHEVILSTIKGGEAPIDIQSMMKPHDTHNNQAFLDNSRAMYQLKNTVPIYEIDFNKIDAVLFPGGYGLMNDVAVNKKVQEVITNFDDQGKFLGFICHAPSVLVFAKKKNGDFLVKGRTVTGFTMDEDKNVDFYDHLVFHLEQELPLKGADYRKKPNWEPHMINDKNLVTGQNIYSVELVTQELVDYLKKI